MQPSSWIFVLVSPSKQSIAVFILRFAPCWTSAVMAKDREEMALWRAAKSCNTKKLQQLVSKESDDDVQALLDQPHPVKGTTPLMVAAMKKYGAETVRALIQLGVDLDATDNGKHRNTALHYAAYNNRIAQLELLLDSGANAFALNGKGHTALDVARLRGRKEAAAALTSRLQVHSGWLHLRSKSLLGFWKRRWCVLLSCNAKGTTSELCIFRGPDKAHPEAVIWRDSLADSTHCSTYSDEKANGFQLDTRVIYQRLFSRRYSRYKSSGRTHVHKASLQPREFVFACDTATSRDTWMMALGSRQRESDYNDTVISSTYVGSPRRASVGSRAATVAGAPPPGSVDEPSRFSRSTYASDAKTLGVLEPAQPIEPRTRASAPTFVADEHEAQPIEPRTRASAPTFVADGNGFVWGDIPQRRAEEAFSLATVVTISGDPNGPQPLLRDRLAAMTRVECIAVWKAARDGDDAKLQQMLLDSQDYLGPNLVNWKHNRKGTTPLMVAAESKRGEAVVRKLIAAGADVNAEDDIQLKNTALHYAAMTNRDSLIVSALLEGGADAFALNRKGLSPLDLARQYHRAEVAATLMEHMQIHCGWLFLRGKFRWKKRWGVVVACNKQRTSKELCIFRHQGELRPDAVLLIDEAARASPFLSNDSFCWLKRDDAFIFDKPVLCQRVKRQKLTRSPICRKTMSQEETQTRDLVFAADSLHNLERWQEVLQSSNFYAPESGAPLVDHPPFDAPHGELYYWPHELVQNVRMSMLRQQEQEEGGDPLFRRLGRALEQHTPDPAPDQEEEPLEDMLRDLQGSNNAERRTPAQVRFAPSWHQKTVEVVSPAQQSPPTVDDSSDQSSSDINAAASSPQNQEQESEDLCGMPRGHFAFHPSPAAMFSLDAPLAPAIDAFVDPENDDAAQKTGLNTVVMQVHRSVSMETLVQTLGPFLTSGDDKVRSRATLLLAEVLTRLPELQLAPSAVQLLVTFFADRLADFPSASACLRALLALETHHAAHVSSPRTTAALVLKLGSTLHIPQLGQAMRKMCFDLMQLALAQPAVVELLLDSVPASKDAQDASVDDAEQSEDLGRQFAQTFLGAMEGEKDPRNLLLCMQVARTLLAKLEPVFSRSDALLRQYFDIVSCYFPIIFTPPPNDPYGITSEGLILSLRHAFAASDLLAPLVLPFLLKKLASTVVEAKLDALQTLVFCGERYSVNALLLQMHAVATALYDEVLDGEKQEVITEARLAISRFSGVVARAKAKDTPGAAYAWSKFVVELTARAAGELRENAADSMVSVSAGQVLAALGHDSSMSFAHVLKIAVPLLVEQLEHESSGSESVPSKCEAALARILLLVDTIDREIDQSGQAQPMRPHAPALIDALVNFLSTDQDNQANPSSSQTARCVAVEALCHLLTFPPSPIVAPAQVKALINLFTRLLLLDPAAEVRAACLKSLKEISTVSTSSVSLMTGGETPATGGYAAFVVEISLARLMAAVNEGSDHEDDDDEEGTGVTAVLAASNRTFDAFFEEALLAITELCRESSIFQATIFLLIDLCVEKADGKQGSIGFCEADGDVTRQRHVDCLLDAVAKIVEINAGDRTSMEFCVQEASSASIVFRLLTAVETSAARATASGDQPGLVDDAKLSACVRIFRAVMQNVAPATQQRLVDAVVPAFLRTHPSEPASLQLVPLFAAVINSAARDVALPETSLVINRLLELAQSGATSVPETSPRQLQAVYAEAALSAAKSLASIVNKMSDGAEFDALIELLLTQKLAVVISNPTEGFAVRVAALQIYAWIAKALVIRGHKDHAPVCLRFLCHFLTPGSQNSDGDVSMDQESDIQEASALRMEVAKTFKLLVSEYPDRMFDLVFPVLLEFIRAHIGEETSVAALVAFAQVIAHSQKAVYLPHLAQIFPLMVQALNTDNRDLGSAAIQTFKPLLLESVESAKPFLKDVFPGLLKQAQFGCVKFCTAFSWWCGLIQF
ncbi:unnamed protein product [Phytophthora fragariaefolia]|uniref:MMS19 nucleotide excision repair protein n=1 Tax=Phytophthora fragariaefolia TaxID=1490495 RepID=A0A9W7CRL2_9STRA|nr:unnamed protein product [Phytophthora fragariaefolia]